MYMDMQWERTRGGHTDLHNGSGCSKVRPEEFHGVDFDQERAFRLSKMCIDTHPHTQRRKGAGRCKDFYLLDNTFSLFDSYPPDSVRRWKF